jgi:hypothetical protein
MVPESCRPSAFRRSRVRGAFTAVELAALQLLDRQVSPAPALRGVVGADLEVAQAISISRLGFGAPPESREQPTARGADLSEEISAPGEQGPVPGPRQMDQRAMRLVLAGGKLCLHIVDQGVLLLGWNLAQAGENQARRVETLVAQQPQGEGRAGVDVLRSLGELAAEILDFERPDVRERKRARWRRIGRRASR